MRPSRAVAAFVLGVALIVPVAHAPDALAAGKAKITAVYFDPGPGPDPDSQLNLEYVVIRNTSTHKLRMKGWKLHDTPRSGSVHTYHFPRFVLRPGASVRIHTGKGTKTRKDLYWGLTYYVWGDDSDKATLVNRAGNVVSTCGWTSSASSPKFC
jgi:hypothetical protein